MKREIEFQELNDEQLDQVVGGHGHNGSFVYIGGISILSGNFNGNGSGRGSGNGNGNGGSNNGNGNGNNYGGWGY